MAISSVLAGLQWNEANGVQEYLRLVLIQKPFILLITLAVVVLCGSLTQLGKHHFNLSYYEISIIWFATSWVGLVTLWLVSGIKPSPPELLGVVCCHIGMGISTFYRVT